VAIVRDITEQKQAQAEAHTQRVQIELQHRLLEQPEQERLQIARDLHDGPVQELTRATFDLRGLLMEDIPPGIAQKLEGVQTILQTQISELRAFAGELRPPTLSKFGLGKALRSHLDTFQERYPDLQASFEETWEENLLSDETRLACFRIYQEALTNIAKHTRATQVSLRLAKAQNQAILEIQDNGQGFIVPLDWIELARAGHLGLVGMRERAEAMGGKLSISSKPGAGTRIRVAIPFDPSSHRPPLEPFLPDHEACLK
jgi:signal transduction histidine kinase